MSHEPVNQLHRTSTITNKPFATSVNESSYNKDQDYERADTFAKKHTFAETERTLSNFGQGLTRRLFYEI